MLEAMELQIPESGHVERNSLLTTVISMFGTNSILASSLSLATACSDMIHANGLLDFAFTFTYILLVYSIHGGRLIPRVVGFMLGLFLYVVIARAISFLIATFTQAIFSW